MADNNSPVAIHNSNKRKYDAEESSLTLPPPSTKRRATGFYAPIFTHHPPPYNSVAAPVDEIPQAKKRAQETAARLCSVRRARVDTGADYDSGGRGFGSGHSCEICPDSISLLPLLNSINDVLNEAETGGSGTVSRRFAGQSGGEEFNLMVPNSKVGLIMGKAGETIKNMQTRTGACIKVLFGKLLNAAYKIGACIQKRTLFFVTFSFSHLTQVGEKPPIPVNKTFLKTGTPLQNVYFLFDKGCPKACYPACIKRDESFSLSAPWWICGWHVCSICQKYSFFLCCTCTFSLCKGCTKGADIVCAKGGKVFCNICLNMVKRIENIELGNKMVSFSVSKWRVKLPALFILSSLHFVGSMGQNSDLVSSIGNTDMSRNERRNMGWECNIFVTLMVGLLFILVILCKFSESAQERAYTYWGYCFKYICGHVFNLQSFRSQSKSELSKVIGIGRYGTIVFQGRHHWRDVAIKRLDRTFYNYDVLKYYTEMKWNEFGAHRNIPFLYRVEKDVSFIYLAFELGLCNMENLINCLVCEGSKKIEDIEIKDIQQLRSGKKYPSDIMLQLLRGVVEALYVMHKLEMTHIRIRPSEVLIMKDNGHLCAKLCYPESEALFTTFAQKINDPAYIGAGWVAPEILRCGKGQKPPYSYGSDIFSLGLLIHFCITGRHVFGEIHERNSKIMKYEMPTYEFVSDMEEAKDLLSGMLKEDTSERIKLQEVRSHPFFWTEKERRSRASIGVDHK